MSFRPTHVSQSGALMSCILSSSGCRLQLSKDLVAIPTNEGVTIAELSTTRGGNNKVIQNIEHPQQVNVLWSQNSAHLVVIGATYIYLYTCVAENDNHKWVRERTVEAPRNLLDFNASYSHPLLSIELIQQSNHNNTGSGEVVVINLLCSLFQTFSIAIPGISGLRNEQHTRSTHSANRLSYSGRYLSTAQITGNNPIHNTPTLGVRVYDLLDLWVLQSPPQASYLDFKYADLSVDSVAARVNSTNSTSEDKQSDFSVGPPAEASQWGVTQLEWRQTDAHSFGSDSFELFFLAQHRIGSAAPAFRRSDSVGIADDQLHYTDTEGASPNTAAYNDVTVSIYSVSQQPDYENISILTMAYNAAIVAGQLNQQDDYLMNISQGNYSGIHSVYASNNDSGANLSALNTPVSALNSVNKDTFTHAATLTTTLNLLTVVSLSSLCRSVDAAPACTSADWTHNNCARRNDVLFCWVELGAARVPSNTQGRTLSSVSAKRTKEEEAGAPLWLAVAYDAHSSHIASHTTTQRFQHSSSSYAYRVFGLKYQQASDGADSSAGAYVPVFVSDDRTCTTLNTGAATLEGPPIQMRCVGDLNQCLNNRQFAPKGGHLLSGAVASKMKLLCSFAVDHSDSGHNKALAVMLSRASVLVSAPPDSALSPASTSTAVTLSTNLLSWNANLVNMPMKPVPPADAVIHASPLLPSASVQFVPVDVKASLFQVVQLAAATHHSQPVSVLSLADLGTGGGACVITAVTADSQANGAFVRHLYVLYSIAGSYHIGVWSLDMSAQQRIARETKRTQRDRDVHYSALQDPAAGAAAGAGVTAASWRAAPVDTTHAPSVVTNTQSATAHTHVHTEEYTVQVLPDPHFGLGIRIDVMDGRTVVSSFKRHPISNLAMSAQLTGCIHPGDEFVAINGIILRGRALAEVIHTIRTTVSEGGDSAVVLTMRRVTNASPSSGTGLALRKPEHVRNISSMSSIASAVSMNSFSDGLDSIAHRAAAAQSTAVATSPSIDHTDASDTLQSSAEIPVCVDYTFVGELALDASVESADLTVRSESPGGASVYLITVHRAAEKQGALCTTLSTVSVNSATVALELVDLCELPLKCGAEGDGSRCTVQLWNTLTACHSYLRCTVLMSPAASEVNNLQSTPLARTSDQMPMLLVQDISQMSARGAHNLQKGVIFDLIPLNGAKTSHPAHQAVSVMLCEDPMSRPGLVASVTLGRVSSAVQLRFQQILKDHVPLCLTRANPLHDFSIDGLTVAAQLLQCLSVANPVSSEGGRVVPAVSPALLRVLEQALAVNASERSAGAASTKEDNLSVALRSIFAVHGSSSTVLQEVDALHLDTSAQRTVWLTVLLKALHRDSTFVAEEAPTSRKFLVHGAAVANLLWSKQTSAELPQPQVLQLLIPNTRGDGTAQSSVLAQLVPPQCDDILEHLTSIHAALWLHDISVLMDIIYKYSVKAFKQHKSSIKIFLEMVLIGKEDTLLQLAKTDREKSGKQLLALLTLEDSFATPKARKSLQKNAFALMKLGRYKDAAAVFLLAEPPFIKEACSVLQTQHDDPLFALLVTRLAEHRCAAFKTTTTGAAKLTGGDANNITAAVAVAVYNGGYLLGPIARMLLKNSVLPSLLACTKRSSLRATQVGPSSSAGASASVQPLVGTTISAAYARIIGTDALVLGLVSAMWLQDHAVLKAAWKESIGRYTLGDACRVSAIAADGAALSTEVVTALASVDWLVEIGAYLGPKYYNSAIQCTNEFMIQAGLHEEVVKTALLHSQAARGNIRSMLNTNTFLQLCSSCYQDYEAHLERVASQPAMIEPEKSDFFFLQGPQDDSTCATPVSSVTNVMFTEGADGGEEDEQYKEVLRRLAKFQATAPDSPQSSIATPVAAAGAIAGAAGLASHSAGGIAARDVDAPAPIKTGGGFNFAASAKPTAPKSVRADPAASAPSALDAFDVPAPPVRRPQRDTRASASAGASLDLLGDGLNALAPPPRHRRPGVSSGTASPTVITSAPKDLPSTSTNSVAYAADEPAPSIDDKHDQVSLEAASTATNATANAPKQRGFNFATTASATASTVSDQAQPAARASVPNPAKSALDDFDSFAAPIRPRRQPAPAPATIEASTEVSATARPAVTPAVPSALDAFDSFDSFAAPTRARRQPQPAPAAVPLEDSASVGSSPRSDITTSPVSARTAVPSALDAFDSFGPPVRARRQHATPLAPSPDAVPADGQDQSLAAVVPAIAPAVPTVAAAPSALDAFDSFDSFAAPTRHTRTKR